MLKLSDLLGTALPKETTAAMTAMRKGLLNAKELETIAKAGKLGKLAKLLETGGMLL